MCLLDTVLFIKNIVASFMWFFLFVFPYISICTETNVNKPLGNTKFATTDEWLTSDNICVEFQSNQDTAQTNPLT